MKEKKSIRQVLRGGGAKHRSRREIFAKINRYAQEIRDAMTSTGALILNSSSWMKRWANDLDPRTIAILTAIRDDPHGFLSRCRQYAPLQEGEHKGQPNYEIGRDRLRQYFAVAAAGEMEDKAVAAYLMNRLAHSTRTRSDVQYASAYDRWNIINDTDLFLEVSAALQGVKLTVGDYSDVLNAPGENIQVLLDPPYVADTLRPVRSRLYSHSFEFIDHYFLAKAVEACPHHVLLTYDDHEYVRKLYSGRKFHVFPASWTYCVSSSRSVGREVIITNYPPEMMGAEVIDITPRRQPMRTSEVA